MARGLPPLGCGAALQPVTTVCQTYRKYWFYDCFAVERGQAPSPQVRSYRGSISMFTDRLPSLALPSGAARAYLRGEWTASHLHFKRLRASVSAKQNGFWQIVH
ncbi:hypothetical protein BOO89_27790 [Stutzerimonas stutzeri]|nr:hypothetical protein BOO89_27790 [Stutzerimonas stutzeri]